MYRYNIVSILLKSIWYRYIWRSKNPKNISFIAFLSDNFFKHQAVNNFAAIYNDFRAIIWPYSFYILTTISIGPEFWPKIGQKLLKKYQKLYQRAKMYWYIDTFSIKNVSMCRYWYILKVSDTDTVSDTMGLLQNTVYSLAL